MPTTRSAGFMAGDRSAGPPLSCARLATWARITEPTRTPLSWASVNDASTSSGSDWSGIRPDRSVTIRGSSRGGTSLISRLSVSIGVRQDAQRSLPLNAAGTGVSRRDVGQPGQLRQRLAAVHDDVVPVPGRELGEGGRRPARGGRVARTNPPATATSTLSASHDFQYCRDRPRSTIATARTAVSPLPPYSIPHATAPPRWPATIRSSC